MSLAARSIGRRFPFSGFVLLAALTAVACGSSTGTAPPSAEPATANSSAPASSVATAAAGHSPSESPAASATPKATPAPPTVKTFWAAVSRGLGAAKHLQVTSAGPNPAVFRFEPAASATIAGGAVAFVCVNGAAYDGQSSGFTRVPGAWQCGADALVSGFRHIGEPADSWNATSPSDAAITETVAQAAGGTWTWSYAATSVFLGGKVTARVTLDPASGRILAARRVDPTGTTTYVFDYALTFPALAVPH